MLGYRARWDVEVVAETGSTNADLLAAARAGVAPGAVLVAGHQSAGRGRLDRTWEAAPGDALLVSLLLRPELPPDQLHRVTWAVGVAAVRACRSLGATDVALKWPNDLVVGERKLAGILAESVVEAGTATAVVVGLGLNLRAVPGGELTDLAVALDDLTPAPVGRDLLVGALLAGLDEVDRHPAELDAAYRGLLATLGRSVAVELASGRLEGTAIDVDPAGDLVVRDASRNLHLVAVGDVVHLR